MSLRKKWVRRRDVCFRCLGSHFARECEATLPCAYCGENIHHKLLCASREEPPHRRAYVPEQPVKRPTQHRSVVTPPRSRTPPRARTPTRVESPIEHVRPPQRHSPERETDQDYRLEQGARRVGQRYQRSQEQFARLRYGQAIEFSPPRD